MKSFVIVVPPLLDVFWCWKGHPSPPPPLCSYRVNTFCKWGKSAQIKQRCFVSTFICWKDIELYVLSFLVDLIDLHVAFFRLRK